MVRVNNIQRYKFSKKSSSENLDNDGLVILVKNLIRINSQNNLPKLPNDFDSWTVKMQHDWINQNIANFLPNLPQSLLSFIPAIFCELDYDQSSEKLPKWMDMDKYRKGQKFAQKHFTAVLLCKIMGLLYFYTFDELLKPVILGEHIHTPYLAFKRFMLVIKRVFSWYSGDPWVKGTRSFKDMEITRMKHLVIKRKVCRMDDEKIAAACIFANPWCPDRDVLQKDFAAVCSSEIFEQHLHTIIKKSPYKPKGINNADLALVQSCLIVATVLYPQNIGIHDATDEDLEAFCHVWKCYGYFLGIKDEYNACRGNLEEIKQRLRDVYQYWVIPNFKILTPEYEHITRCLVTSLNYYPVTVMPYKVMTLMATDALNLNMPHLYASLNFTEWIVYKFYKFLYHSFRFSIVRIIVNKIVRIIYDAGTNFNMEKLEEIHEKSKKIMPDFSLKYNFCQSRQTVAICGNLEEIKQRLRDAYQYWVISNFRELTPEWEHITRCLVVSFKYYPFVYTSFKVVLLFATDAINLSMPHLYASLNFTEWIVYKIYKFLYYSFRFSIVRIIANKIVRSIIDEALNFNEEKLEEIHEDSKKIVPDFSLMY